MSRPRSARGPSAPAAGRTAGGRPGVYVTTPKSDIFVVLLGVALGAMVLGCLLLLLILNRYGFSTKATSLTTAPRMIAAALPEKIFTVHL